MPFHKIVPSPSPAIKVRQSRKQISVLNSSKKRTKLTSLSKDDAQNSELHRFFGRLEETINCFRDLLTFKFQRSKANFQNI